ncbi:MAG TPA: MASE1 domain-containing protein [Nitrospiraceae bacterium]|nr:MASE1 domain-containing protein [Nitrospiraceae bacterium]
MLTIAAVTAVYVITGKLGLLLAFVNASATAVWPPTGIALAALLYYGYRVWPAVFIGAFLVNHTTAGTIETSAAIAAGNTLEALSGAYLALTFANGREAFNRVRDLAGFTVLTAVVSTMVGATIGVTALTLAGMAEWNHYGTIWLTWWLGNVEGNLIVAPVLLLWAQPAGVRWDRRQRMEIFCAFIVLVVVGQALFGGWWPFQDTRYPVDFLAIPILAWIALRFGPRETATASFLLSMLAVWGTLRGLGPFAPHPPNESLLLLQAFMSVVGLMALALSASAVERRQLEVTLRHAHAEAEHAVHEGTTVLHERTDALSALIQSAPIAIVSIDLQGRITRWNPAAERIFGWRQDQVLGDLPPFIRKDQLAEFEELRERVLQGHTLIDIGLQRQRKDGTPINIRLSAAPLRDAHARIAGVMAVIIDMTEQKSLEEQFHQSQKLEAVGRLAGGIAHDFNNILLVITGYSEMLLSTLPEGDPQRVSIEEIHNAGKRAAALTAQLLAFSRRQVLQPQLMDLNAVVFGLDAMLQRLIGEDIQLILAPDESLGLIHADPGQMEQVVMNLVVNARDAMPQGGRLTLTTRNLDLSAPSTFGRTSIPPGRYVMLAVGDTGIGMDDEMQDRIFEPFFTTKEPGQGTGLGLATTYGIINQSMGYITVSSEPGHGSTFTIYLPRAEAEVGALKPRVPARDMPHGAETVLIVEDEPGVRAIVSDTLKQHGYTTLQARHGIEALLLGHQRKEPLHLVITDVVMPQMNGREVAEQLRLVHPEMKVLYMSGYTDDAVVRHGILQAETPFLQKPFTSQALVRKVRDVLDAKTAQANAPSPPGR